MRKQKIIGIVIIIVIILAILGINNRSIFNDDEQVIQDKQQIKQENLGYPMYSINMGTRM